MMLPFGCYDNHFRLCLALSPPQNGRLFALWSVDGVMCRRADYGALWWEHLERVAVEEHWDARFSCFLFSFMQQLLY